MLIAGRLLLPHGPDQARTAPGQLLIEGDRIAQISLDEPIGTPDLGHPWCLVSPGFIDTHLHLPQFDVIGIDGLPLLEWLNAAVFPAEARWADADFAGDMTARVASRLRASGTTGIAAYATVHHAGTRAATDALHRSGLRAIVGQVLMDQNAPPELCRPALQLLKEAADFKPLGRVQPAVTPRFAVSCSHELLAGAGKLAAQTGWPVQTHLSETRDEVSLVAKLHGGLGYVDVYKRSGLLGPRTILGHGIWLSDTERKTLAESKSIVAHCPTANLFLQAGRMDRAAAHTTGVRTALGSDVAGGPDISMVRVARAMLENVKSLRLDNPKMPLITAAQAWHQITAGNADALGWSDAGRLAVGATADIVVIDPTRRPNLEPRWTEAPDPLSKLLYAWDDRWIVTTIVAGVATFADGAEIFNAQG